MKTKHLLFSNTMRLIGGLEEKHLNFISTACYLKLKVTNCGAARIYKSIYKRKTNIKFHLNPTEKKEKIRKKLLRDLPQSLLIKRVSSTDIEIKKLRNKLSKMQKMNMCGFLHDWPTIRAVSQQNVHRKKLMRTQC